MIFIINKYQSCLDQKSENEAYLKELYENKDQELYDSLEAIESKVSTLQSDIDKAGGKK